MLVTCIYIILHSYIKSKISSITRGKAPFNIFQVTVFIKLKIQTSQDKLEKQTGV